MLGVGFFWLFSFVFKHLNCNYFPGTNGGNSEEENEGLAWEEDRRQGVQSKCCESVELWENLSEDGESEIFSYILRDGGNG